MATIIRLANEHDAVAIAAIYAPLCIESAVSFEEEAPTAAEMAHRIAAVQEHLPWLVYDDDAVRGYAYAGRHRDRAAYRWSADVSVYVEASFHRCGIGRALYTALFDWLLRLGYYNAYAGITLPNAASVGLHESMGFVKIAEYPHVGYKLGQWHNTGWWHKPLRSVTTAPAEPRLLAVVDCEITKTQTCVEETK